MKFELVIDGETVQARLPFMPSRCAVLGEYVRIVGTKEQRAAGHREDREELATLRVAALGLVGQGAALGVAPLQAFGGNVLEYGTAVWEALFRAGRKDFIQAAVEACDRIIDSVPTPEEVEAAADPFASRLEELSTAGTSSSG